MLTRAARKCGAPTSEAPEDKVRRDELIIEYNPLVTAIALGFQKSFAVHTGLEDLIHAGTAGLLDAASKHRDYNDVSFPSYAKYRIRAAIQDSLRQEGRMQTEVLPDSAIDPILDRATKVIGDRQEAMRWLGTPVRGLDFATRYHFWQQKRDRSAFTTFWAKWNTAFGSE